MAELDRLLELNARLQLIPKGNTADELLRNASNFTRAAAQMLYFEGWGRIRKTSGTQVDGFDADKLMHHATRRVVDIVQSAGAPSARVQWLDHGAIGNLADYVPIPPDASKPDEPKDPPPDVDQALLEVANAVDGLTHNVESLRLTIAGVREELEATRALLARIAARYGVMN